MRILIADDDRHTRAGLRAFLGTYPACTVVGEAVNGEDAIVQVECCRPGVVLLDVHMPVLDGLQAARIIKGRWPEVVLVLLTMDSTQSIAAAAVQAGADAFVGKADGPDRLIQTLQALCDRGSPGEDTTATSSDPAA